MTALLRAMTGKDNGDCVEIWRDEEDVIQLEVWPHDTPDATVLILSIEDARVLSGLFALVSTVTAS